VGPCPEWEGDWVATYREINNSLEDFIAEADDEFVSEI
jgi:hypothetical protein